MTGLPTTRTCGWKLSCSCPHQALAMKTPGELTRSPHLHGGLAPVTYPWHDWAATVTHCGRICYDHRKINLSQVFAGQDVGVRQ